MMEQLLTARELADKIGMPATWILTEWRAGRLPGYRLSYRAVRFRESDVEAWLETKRRGPDLAQALEELARQAREAQHPRPTDR